MSTALTAPQRHKLNDLETIIESGLQTFVEVGVALSQIRDQKLYTETHETFEAYCQERWGWTSARARQLMGSAEVVAEVGNRKEFLTVPESHAVELVPVPEGQRADALRDAHEAAAAEGREPTAKDVRKAREKYTPIKERKPPKPKAPEPESAGDMAAAITAAAEKHAESTPPPSRVAAPRLPAIPRIRDMIRACTDVEDVPDAELRRLPMNDITLGHLARAHEIIGKILHIHRKGSHEQQAS